MPHIRRASFGIGTAPMMSTTSTSAPYPASVARWVADEFIAASDL